MKKKVLLVTALFTAMLSQAQEASSDEVIKNKKGHEILPKAGDIGIGFNTIPIIDLFMGTLSRQTVYPGAGNIVSYTQASNNQIVGKYFLTPKSAIRVRFGINTLSGSMKNQVQDASAMYKATLGTQDDINAAALLRVEDKSKFSKNNTLFAVGYEMRRGYRRLQGFYGGEIGFGTNGGKQTIEYGNAFSDLYPVQYTSNFNTFAIATENPLTAGRTTRALEINNRGGIRFGVRGFIGIEYFIFSKISIGAEYGWAYSVTTRKGSTIKQEVYNNGQKGPEVIIEKVDSDTSENLKGFSVDNNSGSVFSLNNTLGGNTALSGGAGALTIIFHF